MTKKNFSSNLISFICFYILVSSTSYVSELKLTVKLKNTNVYVNEPVLFSGRVTDSEGNDVQNVKVYVEDNIFEQSRFASLTDSYGNFSYKSGIPSKPGLYFFNFFIGNSKAPMLVKVQGTNTFTPEKFQVKEDLIEAYELPVESQSGILLDNNYYRAYYLQQTSPTHSTIMNFDKNAFDRGKALIEIDLEKSFLNNLGKEIKTDPFKIIIYVAEGTACVGSIAAAPVTAGSSAYVGCLPLVMTASQDAAHAAINTLKASEKLSCTQSKYLHGGTTIAFGIIGITSPDGRGLKVTADTITQLSSSIIRGSYDIVSAPETVCENPDVIVVRNDLKIGGNFVKALIAISKMSEK